METLKTLKLFFAASAAKVADLVFRRPRKPRGVVAEPGVAEPGVAEPEPPVKTPGAGRHGPARQYTDDERRERHRLAQLAYETRERAKRGEPAPLPAKDQLKLGVGPARENRKAYNRAYYLHSKKTGNPAPE